MYDYRVVLERDDSTRRMKLPLEFYGTDEQAALGPWVRLEANISPLQDAPVVADPTPRAMNSSVRLLSRNIGHTDIVLDVSVVLFGAVSLYVQQCSTVLFLDWYLYLVPGIYYGG